MRHSYTAGRWLAGMCLSRAFRLPELSALFDWQSEWSVTAVFWAIIFALLTPPPSRPLSFHYRTSPRLGVIFDTISVKARWERGCRWNCDLRVINAWKKGIFCRTESVAMTPKSRDHMPITSLRGVAAKWPTRAPKTKLILCPRDPQGYSRISLSLSGRILKEYRNIVSASTCGIPWGLRNRTHWSARYTNGRDAVQQENQLV